MAAMWDTFKSLERRQKESNLNDFCRFPCRGHCKFTVWNGVSQKRLPCGILFITQPPIAKVGWDCSESKVMPTKRVNNISHVSCKSGLRLQRKSSSSADMPRGTGALLPQTPSLPFGVNDNVRPCSDTKGPEQASVIYIPEWKCNGSLGLCSVSASAPLIHSACVHARVHACMYACLYVCIYVYT